MITTGSCRCRKKTEYNVSRAMRKCVMSYSNNKGADQPAHPQGRKTSTQQQQLSTDFHSGFRESLRLS